eukprot:TRINITY_DN1025_c0_g1_i1.p1 TRINITY_DN1025_c0_g1~~TRINITY_DN1025_c0_g1_i1.p1  ORF type:complete len:697 (-),score=165.21 TRINITY_DN1025_c0_g1_i1:39-2129(-)
MTVMRPQPRCDDADAAAGYADSEGCRYTSASVVAAKLASEEFYACAIWHNQYFSASLVFGEDGDLQYLSGCYWDMDVGTTDWQRVVALRQQLELLLADDTVRTTEKIRLRYVHNEVVLVMALVENGHFFEAFASFWQDSAWYDDPTLDAARTAQLLASVDHSGEDGYADTVLHWLREYAKALPRWRVLMERAVAQHTTHASVVMQAQTQIYLDALAVDFTLVCPSLPEGNPRTECGTLAAQINNASASFAQYFEHEYVPACMNLRPDAKTGLWSTTNGTAVYQAWLDYHLGYAETARHIYDMGVTRVQENKQSILSTMQLIDPSVTTFEGAASSLANGNDTRWYICGNDTTVVKEYVRQIMSTVEDCLIPEFLYFPGVRVEVTVTGSPSTYSSPASYDYERNFWLVHPHYNVGQYDYCISNDAPGVPQHFYDRLQLATVVHEAMPGHGYQLALESEVDCGIGAPYAVGSTLYYEGWGLYSETEPYHMANDVYGPKGLYTEPTSELSYYTGTMLRNVRLKVDSAMHGDITPDPNYSWSDCVAEMIADSFSESLARSECERYVQCPAQATAYMLGGLKFAALRNTTVAALGAAFSVGEFHNVVTRWGAMRMDELEQLVGTYIAFKRAPSREDPSLDRLWGIDIVRADMWSHARPYVGIGRDAAASTSPRRAPTQAAVVERQRAALRAADARARPFVAR